MQHFTYEAVDGSGALTRGVIEADARSFAVDKLVADGLTPLSVAVSARATLRPWLGRITRRSEMISLASELATLLNAGLTAERAVTVVRELSPGKARDSKLAALADKLRAGSTFADAFAAAMPESPAYISQLLAAGEMSGHLPEVMKRLSENLTRAKLLRDRLISGLTYPALLVGTMTIVLYVIFSAVLPRLKPMFDSAGDALPTPTAILLGFGEFFATFGWFLLGGTVLAIVWFTRSLQQEPFRLRVDRYLMRSRLAFDLPRQYEGARFCRNLQILLSGGLPLDRAIIAATNTVSNRWVQGQLRDVHAAVIGGQRLKAALANIDALPPLVTEFAAVGEETGQLASMLDEAARVLDAGVEKRLDRMVALALPGATLVMGLLVAGIMIGIVSGILAVNDLAL